MPTAVASRTMTAPPVVASFCRRTNLPRRVSGPARLAAIAAPTLVIHGAKDYRVPDAQGLAYYNTLKALGVDARLLWFPDENHWVLKPKNSKQWHQTVLDWLDRWLKKRFPRNTAPERMATLDETVALAELRDAARLWE